MTPVNEGANPPPEKRRSTNDHKPEREKSITIILLVKGRKPKKRSYSTLEKS